MNASTGSTPLRLVRAGAIFCMLVAGVQAVGPDGQVTIRQMIGDPRYWPPPCDSDVCVLTGLGGIVQVWFRHVDRNLALGRSFIVKGVCASACEMAAQRAKAKVMAGARLIPHPVGPTIWQ